MAGRLPRVGGCCFLRAHSSAYRELMRFSYYGPYSVCVHAGVGADHSQYCTKLRVDTLVFFLPSPLPSRTAPLKTTSEATYTIKLIQQD